MTKRALVTGSAGLVGRHLTKALARDGWEVHGCDLQDGNDCRSLFAQDDTRYSLVAHCAAVVGGRLTISGDPLAIAVDLELDAAMFAWAVRTRQERVVYFSSSAAYPTAIQVEGHRCKESDLTLAPSIGAPDLVYGWAKVTGEMLAGFAESEGIPVHTFRPFSGYAEDQDLDYPWPTYIDRAVQRLDPFPVWGDGRQVRDFIAMEDICNAVITAVAEDIRDPVNLGTGIPTDFDTLARMCADAAGYEPELAHDLSKPVGPSWRVADATLMRTFYEPRIELADAVRRAVKARRKAA